MYQFKVGVVDFIVRIEWSVNNDLWICGFSKLSYYTVSRSEGNEESSHCYIDTIRCCIKCL